jgi:hypothetical protein
MRMLQIAQRRLQVLSDPRARLLSHTCRGTRHLLRYRRAGRDSRQFGRASAPTIPHLVHTIRGPNVGTGTSSGQGALMIARWWHCQHRRESHEACRPHRGCALGDRTITRRSNWRILSLSRRLLLGAECQPSRNNSEHGNQKQRRDRASHGTPPSTQRMDGYHPVPRTTTALFGCRATTLLIDGSG